MHVEARQALAEAGGGIRACRHREVKFVPGKAKAVKMSAHTYVSVLLSRESSMTINQNHTVQLTPCPLSPHLYPSYFDRIIIFYLLILQITNLDCILILFKKKKYSNTIFNKVNDQNVLTYIFLWKYIVFLWCPILTNRTHRSVVCPMNRRFLCCVFFLKF